MNVLHVSIWNHRCAIADFTEHIVRHLADHQIASEVFPLDAAELRHLTTAEFLSKMDCCAQRAAGFDLIHVQHHFGLYSGTGGLHGSLVHFGHLLSTLEAVGRPVVVTFHAEPEFAGMLDAEFPRESIPEPEIAASLKWLKRKMRHWHIMRLWSKRVVPFFARRSDRFRALTLTRMGRVRMIDSGFAAENVTYWPHGILQRDPRNSGITRDQAKARLGLPADSILLSIFGFVLGYKGHLPAAQALKTLPPQYRLAIVGGPHPENATDKTLNSVLEAWEGEDPERLIVTGYASRETIDLYHAATDICLAPHLAGFNDGSGSICWALTSGRPTIASHIPPFSEIHAEGDCLRLCTPNAVHELAWHIQKLSDDVELQQKLAMNALQFAARHSWSRVAADLVDIYREMTGVAGRIGERAANNAAPGVRVPLRKVA